MRLKWKKSSVKYNWCAFSCGFIFGVTTLFPNYTIKYCCAIHIYNIWDSALYDATRTMHTIPNIVAYINVVHHKSCALHRSNSRVSAGRYILRAFWHSQKNRQFCPYKWIHFEMEQRWFDWVSASIECIEIYRQNFMHA